MIGVHAQGTTRANRKLGVRALLIKPANFDELLGLIGLALHQASSVGPRAAKVAFFVAALALIGCRSPIKTYEGADRPEAATAYLSAVTEIGEEGWLARSRTTVVSIDGKAADTGGPGDQYVLLPGEHQLKVRYERESGGMPLCGYFGCEVIFSEVARMEVISIGFVARAGHEYGVLGSTESETSQVQITVWDFESESVVAGVYPAHSPQRYNH